MSFPEKNKIIFQRLFLAGAATGFLGIYLQFRLMLEGDYQKYYYLCYAIAVLALTGGLIFWQNKPERELTEDEEETTGYKEYDGMARNAYIFTILMLFTGAMTLSSTAERVAGFFFLIGVLSLLASNILHYLTLKRYNSYK